MEEIKRGFHRVTKHIFSQLRNMAITTYDTEFCSVGCISTGTEVFANITETLRWKWFYLRFFSPSSRGNLLPNYMSSCQPESAHTYKYRHHAIPWFLNKMQWQYKSVETQSVSLPTSSKKTIFWRRLFYKNWFFFLPYFSIYISIFLSLFFFFLSIYTGAEEYCRHKLQTATYFPLGVRSSKGFTSPVEVQVEW